MRVKAYLAVLTCFGLAAGGASLASVDGLSLTSAAHAKGAGNSGGHGNGGRGGSSNGKSSAGHDKSAAVHGKSATHRTFVATSQSASVTRSFGALSAAHASATAREHAAPNSAVGKIATYESSREAALALQDPAAQAQALDDAEMQLAAAFGRTELSAAEIDRINALLDARQ
jgi:hypothetical protein